MSYIIQSHSGRVVDAVGDNLLADQLGKLLENQDVHAHCKK